MIAEILDRPRLFPRGCGGPAKSAARPVAQHLVVGRVQCSMEIFHRRFPPAEITLDPAAGQRTRPSSGAKANACRKSPSALSRPPRRAFSFPRYNHVATCAGANSAAVVVGHCAGKIVQTNPRMRPVMVHPVILRVEPQALVELLYRPLLLLEKRPGHASQTVDFRSRLVAAGPRSRSPRRPAGVDEVSKRIAGRGRRHFFRSGALAGGRRQRRPGILGRRGRGRVGLLHRQVEIGQGAV